MGDKSPKAKQREKKREAQTKNQKKEVARSKAEVMAPKKTTATK
jgi:hypothetical protein